MEIIINGKAYEAEDGMTVLEAARANDEYIPTLCAYEGLGPKASCKLCIVKIDGEDKDKLACAIKVKESMVITTKSDELYNKRRETVQEMFRQHTVDCHHCLRIGSSKCDDLDPTFCESCFFCDCVRDGFCELQEKAREFKIDVLPFEIHEHDFGIDDSTGSVIRNMDKCIKCRRCVDICKAQAVGILGIKKNDRGHTVGTMNDLMTDGCVRCGRCVDVCPTGALYIQEHKDELVYTAHKYGTETAAMISASAVNELQKLYKENFDFEQVVAALKKIGIDRVYSPSYARAASLNQEIKLLDKMLGKEKLILTDSYAAKNFLQASHPELKKNFAFFDSMQKCFGDFMHENRPGTKLINISCENGNAAEAHETGCVDFFVNARELYRIFLRTGGAPAKKRPVQVEELGEYKKPEKYEPILSAGGWYVSGNVEELNFENDGKTYKAAICHNLSLANEAIENIDKYDVIKIMT